MQRLRLKLRRRSIIGNFLTLALCSFAFVQATATTMTLPVITSVQLNLPATGKVTLKGTGFGTTKPTVTGCGIQRNSNGHWLPLWPR